MIASELLEAAKVMLMVGCFLYLSSGCFAEMALLVKSWLHPEERVSVANAAAKAILTLEQLARVSHYAAALTGILAAVVTFNYIMVRWGMYGRA